MPSEEGNEAPVIFSAVLTILFSLFRFAITKPGSDAVSEYVFSGSSVEDSHGWSGKVRSPQSTEALLGLLDDGCGFMTGGHIICQMYPQELVAVYPVYHRTTGGQWRMMVGVSLPEVNGSSFWFCQY